MLSLILAILGLSFLIFIHELGHYLMARREGMRVETFSIGFGKPIFSWTRSGVKWQLGWIPFGGFVKIAGTDTDKKQDLYAVKDGFFGRGPWARIKVAFMGPLANIVFALMVFALLWVNGGRDKSFVEYTHKIGYVDPQSELYQRGIRPGDEIVSYDGKVLKGSADHVYATLFGSDVIDVKGSRVDYRDGSREPFEYNLKSYSHPSEKKWKSIGILNPASYIIYDKFPSGKENPLVKGSPLETSGIQYGDRVVWMDGYVLFSVPHMHALLNDGKALLTVKRGDQIILVRVPRVKISEFRLDPEVKEEFTDWQYEANIKGQKLQDLFAIPYNLTQDGVVENQLKFLDKDVEEKIFPSYVSSSIESPLLPRDKIIGVDGKPVKFAYQIFSALQTRAVTLIVERKGEPKALQLWTEADKTFDSDYNFKNLDQITHSIGLDKPVTKSGEYVLLAPVTPKMQSQLALNPTLDAARKKILDSMNSEDREALEKRWNENDRQYVVGFIPQDRKVQYNPVPTELFWNEITQIGNTLKALFTRTISVDSLKGPVGIVSIVQSEGSRGIDEILFWLGFISLNLGILNLLPIPVLDGGTIMMSLFEVVTGKKIQPKTMEKLILPFAILLILFFVYVTFNDISNLLKSYIPW